MAYTYNPSDAYDPRNHAKAPDRHIFPIIREIPAGRFAVDIVTQTTASGNYQAAQLDGFALSLSEAKWKARQYLHGVIADAALALQELER